MLAVPHRLEGHGLRQMVQQRPGRDPSSLIGLGDDRVQGRQGEVCLGGGRSWSCQRPVSMARRLARTAYPTARRCNDRGDGLVPVTSPCWRLNLRGAPGVAHGGAFGRTGMGTRRWW